MDNCDAYRDYTVKVAINDSSSVLQLLKGLNAEFRGVDNQRDFYFRTKVGKLKLRQGVIENLITHYVREEVNGTERTKVIRYDRNPSDGEIDRLRKRHALIGTIEKERKIFFIQNVKIHVDKLKDGREFLELEAFDRENRFSESELREQCLQVLGVLGFSASQIIKTGYFIEGQN